MNENGVNTNLVSAAFPKVTDWQKLAFALTSVMWHQSMTLEFSNTMKRNFHPSLIAFLQSSVLKEWQSVETKQSA